MSLFEQPPKLGEAGYQKLVGAAMEESRGIDPTELYGDRPEEQAVFLYDRSNLLDMGVDVQRRDGGYHVALHFPDINAFAPPGSATDALIYNESARDWGIGRKTAEALWTPHFGEETDCVPALSILFSIKQRGQTLAIGRPSVRGGLIKPTYKHFASLDRRGRLSERTPPSISDAAVLADKLAAQRVRLGALSVRGGGYNWVYDGGHYKPDWQSRIIRNELSRAANASIGSALAADGVPALFRYIQSDLTASDVKLAVDRYRQTVKRIDQNGKHSGLTERLLQQKRLAANELRSYLAQARPRFNAQPVQPCADSHGSYGVLLQNAHRRYSSLLNRRIAEAAAGGRAAYGLGELAAYAAYAAELNPVTTL